jgi:hypothetical protein
MKLLIIGHGRHGKDTLAEIWARNFGLKYAGSSIECARIFIFDALKEKYGYKEFVDCFDDRVNHREEWHNMICEYNTPDKARLAKEILTTCDCYVGMRSGYEIDECVKQEIFNLIIWVDASDRLPLEDPSSFNIDKSYADVIIDNNNSKSDFIKRACSLGDFLFNGS